MTYLYLLLSAYFLAVSCYRHMHLATVHIPYY